MAWQKLTPIVREDNSEIWVTSNPETKGSPTDLRFRQNPPKNSAIVELNYNDNPFFPDVLEQERLNDLARLDYATYAWILEEHIFKIQKNKCCTASILLKRLMMTYIKKSTDCYLALILVLLMTLIH